MSICSFPFLLTKFDWFAIIWVDKETAFLLLVKGCALFRYLQIPCASMVFTEVAVLWVCHDKTQQVVKPFTLHILTAFLF
jgi:hypothetical protein